MFKDLVLGLTYKSAGRNHRVGRSKQRPVPKLDSEIGDIDGHGRIEQIRRPELPARQSLPSANHPQAHAIKRVCEGLDVINRRLRRFYLRLTCETESIEHEGLPVRPCRYRF